jgi:hypothetical protein
MGVSYATPFLTKYEISMQAGISDAEHHQKFANQNRD